MIGTLQILLAINTKLPDFKDDIHARARSSSHDHRILQTILHLVAGNYTAAKSNWLQNVLGQSASSVKDPTYRSEDEYGFAGIKHWFPISRNYVCENGVCGTTFEETGEGYRNDSIFDVRPFSIDHLLLW